MAKLCHDQYDHPLLWCDAKRRAEEKRIADESWTLARHRKEQKEAQKIRDCNELRELIEKHYPWGRPGGGAPNGTIRRNNIESRGLFAESSENCRKFIFQAPFRARRGGGGAPLRNSAGQIITKFREDPIITFSDSARKHVENHLRYKTSNEQKKQYKMDLDRCRAERMRRDAKNSLDMNEVWGKSGPGGMPWRHPRQVGQSFMKSMGWTDKILLQTLDPDKKPKANGIDASDVNRLKLPAQCCVNCFCDCKTKYATMQCNGKENVMENIPMTRKDNPENASRPLCEHMNRCAKKCKYVKPRACMISGGVELVPLLAKRRAMQRPISLSTTDVTKNPTEKKWQDYGEGVQLLDDLCRQITQKERKKQLSKDSELESARRHFETIDTFWGRPGHGAPRSVKTNHHSKLNLNDLLYKPRLSEHVSNTIGK
ncbi:uncharacterized protein LOC129577875 [Sitodiplosis mosellana]|uniref:uncharacterized protein LOC129577875 n=1 Tax=Sitodiplosis mosellana TaxID=263140 RepID=UPI002444D56E|nr:uncharacterized protein LOC129577875 [Sitodiplosis mosellana]